MVDFFEREICSYCKNTNCKKEIKIKYEKGVTTYKCDEAIKSQKKNLNNKKSLDSYKKNYFSSFIEV